MAFAQLVEYHTSHLEELQALEKEWRAQTEGIRPDSVGYVASDRDRPDTYVVFVRWESYADAQRNNDLPATREIAERIADLCDEPPIFRNLDVISERPL
jgi:quinol monooxygenase YgiN